MTGQAASLSNQWKLVQTLNSYCIEAYWTLNNYLNIQ